MHLEATLDQRPHPGAIFQEPGEEGTGAGVAVAQQSWPERGRGRTPAGSRLLKAGKTASGARARQKPEKASTASGSGVAAAIC
jgi:hypothetical protein